MNNVFERPDTWSPLEFLDLGCVEFAKVRMLQEESVERRARGEITDRIIFCEHPPVLTCGRRTPTETLKALGSAFAAERLEPISVSRGGQATWHGPGQLMIYPVISLRAHGLGVRRFVQVALESISEVLAGLGLNVQCLLEPAGLWVRGKKVCAVGLEIRRGITNHGFCLNIDCSLEPFSRFSACGLQPGSATSVAAELGSKVGYARAAAALQERFSGAFGAQSPVQSVSSWREL